MQSIETSIGTIKVGDSIKFPTYNPSNTMSGKVLQIVKHVLPTNTHYVFEIKPDDTFYCKGLPIYRTNNDMGFDIIEPHS